LQTEGSCDDEKLGGNVIHEKKNDRDNGNLLTIMLHAVPMSSPMACAIMTIRRLTMKNIENRKTSIGHPTII
jgi:hypothetical protein